MMRCKNIIFYLGCFFSFFNGFIALARDDAACRVIQKELMTIEMETGQVCYFEFEKPVSNIYGGIVQLADVAIVTNKKVVFTAKRSGSVDVLAMKNGVPVKRVRIQINLPPPAPNLITSAENIVSVKKMVSKDNKVTETYLACNRTACRDVSSADIKRHRKDLRTLDAVNN